MTCSPRIRPGKAAMDNGRLPATAGRPTASTRCARRAACWPKQVRFEVDDPGDRDGGTHPALGGIDGLGHLLALGVQGDAGGGVGAFISPLDAPAVLPPGGRPWTCRGPVDVLPSRLTHARRIRRTTSTRLVGRRLWCLARTATLAAPRARDRRRRQLRPPGPRRRGRRCVTFRFSGRYGSRSSPPMWAPGCRPSARSGC